MKKLVWIHDTKYVFKQIAFYKTFSEMVNILSALKYVS